MQRFLLVTDPPGGKFNPIKDPTMCPHSSLNSHKLLTNNRLSNIYFFFTDVLFYILQEGSANLFFMILLRSIVGKAGRLVCQAFCSCLALNIFLVQNSCNWLKNAGQQVNFYIFDNFKIIFSYL